MSLYAKEFLEKLHEIMLNISSYNPSCNPCFYAALAIGTIIEHSAADINPYLSKYLTKLVDAFEITLNLGNFNNDKEIQEAYQGFLCSCISSIIVGNRIPINNEQFNFLYNLLIQTFKMRGDIYKEGMLVLSSLGSCKTIIITSYLTLFYLLRLSTKHANGDGYLKRIY